MHGNLQAIALIALPLLTGVLAAWLRVAREEWGATWKGRIGLAVLVGGGVFLLYSLVFVVSGGRGDPTVQMGVTCLCAAAVLILVRGRRLPSVLGAVILVLGGLLSMHYIQLINSERYIGTSGGRAVANGIIRPVRLWHTGFTRLWQVKPGPRAGRGKP